MLLAPGSGDRVASVSSNTVLPLPLETNSTTITAGDPRVGSEPVGTIALILSSPAIDQGVNGEIPVGITTDQRGFDRIQGTAVDVGAFERQPSDPP